ncbi:hypothetical protein C818_02493 [Lachnospiraceae bacterium MD308]|jgi:Signal transduction histidine kinase|nr:hypothetical protein C818_02493 [Lachnospiraceae bacterium MD308]MCI8502310.1 HAMP domain-containing histidine kinase [Dorea sp.]
MTFAEYIKDKALLLALHFFCMLLLGCFLCATGYPTDYCVLIATCWALIATAYFAADYYRRRSYFLGMSRLLEQMDERYLLGELLPDSPKLEDRLYRGMLRMSNKSVIEKIHAIEQEKKEYREFIESWIHDVKAPITGISLICENNRNELTKKIRLENSKIENCVEMALYYARSDEVYKDYMIRRTALSEVAADVIMRNKHLLIQNGVIAEIDCEHFVYTDEKWISFILNQLVQNSAKYKKDGGERICVCTKKQQKSVWLVVEDDGAGVKKEELPRIFEKGFTGSNGRQDKRATGMGLYLCKNLCEKLGIEIVAHSEEKKGTRIILKFPVGNYHARDGKQDNL